MDKKVRHILNYYAETAHFLGVKDDGADNNFSLEWFFNSDKCIKEYDKDCISDLNALTMAFLGDDEAYKYLTFSSAEYSDIDEYLLEGRFKPNNNQHKAILNALNNSISFIQGPPGTGKTEVILNIASVAINTNKTVAVVSRNKATIDNIETKLKEYEKNEFKVDNVFAKNQNFLFNSFAKLGNKSMRKAWNMKYCDSKFKFSEEEGISWERNIFANEFLSEFPFVTGTMHSLKKMFCDGDKYRYDYVIIDEASQCDILAGLIAMSSAKHLALVGDKEQLQPIYNETYGIEDKYTDIDLCYKMKEPNGADGQSILISAEKAEKLEPKQNTVDG